MDLMHFISEPVKWTDVALLMVATLTAIFGIKQIRETGKQIEISQRSVVEDHERSRRMSAIDLCIQWTKFLEPEMRAIAQLFESFDEHQCFCISEFKPMQINADQRDVLNAIFTNKDGISSVQSANDSDGTITLSPNQVLFLRHSVLKYLNMLESVLLSYTQSTASQSILESEFQYIFEERERETALDNFRRVIGAQNYPAISLFITEIKKKQATRDHTVAAEKLASFN